MLHTLFSKPVKVNTDDGSLGSDLYNLSLIYVQGTIHCGYGLITEGVSSYNSNRSEQALPGR